MALSTIAANCVVIVGGAWSAWEFAKRWPAFVKAAQDRAAAEERIATATEDAVVINAPGVGEEAPSSAAQRLRAKIAFDAYNEWTSDFAHFATGKASKDAHGPDYERWLWAALHRLETVLIEAHRSRTEDHWTPRVRVELQKHAHTDGLRRLDVERLSYGPLRELIRQLA